MTDVIHLAGIDVTCRGQVRQLCAWCGATLIDADQTLMAWPESTPVEERRVAPYEPMALVRTAAGQDGPLRVKVGEVVEPVLLDDGAMEIPAGACFDVPSDVGGLG